MAHPEPPTEVPLPQLPAAHPAQAYAALPIQELLAAVQRAGSDRTAAGSQAVFAALYYRYYAYLFTVVSNSLGFICDRDGIQEIVDDALAAFFRASDKFRFATAPDEANYDRQVRSYLGQLARWKAGRARSFQKSFGADAIDLDELDARLNDCARFGQPGAEDAAAAPADDPRIEHMTSWLESLREIERDVLRTYFLDDHAGRKSSRLPGGVALRLAQKHGVTPSNIRHLKLKLARQMREHFRAA